MKLRILSVLLVCLLVFGLVPGAMATEPAETTEVTKPVRGEFECGDELTWTYEDGVLTITGQGEMDDYEEDAPWAKYKDEMEAVILEGVTYIGARAFKDYDELESVDFGDKLYEIGEEAFWSCSSLTEIRLPASFKVFGPSSFSGCKNLTEIHSEGKFPSFRQNCFWDTYATIYFPAARPWSVDLIQQLEEALRSEEFGAARMADTLCQQLMIGVNRDILRSRTAQEEQDSYRVDPKLEGVLKYIAAHLEEELSVDLLAKQFYMSRYYLMHRFKEVTGYTVHQYITQKRVLKAGELIRAGIPVMKAAEESGFSEYSSFLRAFQKTFHMSPREFR